MSRSGKKYRDPFALDAMQRKAGPHKETKRQALEELDEQETRMELEQMESVVRRGSEETDE